LRSIENKERTDAFVQRSDHHEVRFRCVDVNTNLTFQNVLPVKRDA